MRQEVAYKTGQKQWKSLTVRPKEWSRLLTGGCRLQEVLTKA